MGIGALAPLSAASPTPSAGDDLLEGQREAARRGFFVGMSLAASADDRADVAAAFLRNAGRFGTELDDPANAALVAWARNTVAKGGHHLLDYRA